MIIKYEVDDLGSLDDLYAAKYTAWLEGQRLKPAKGISWALLLSIPVWVAIGFVVWAWTR